MCYETCWSKGTCDCHFVEGSGCGWSVGVLAKTLIHLAAVSLWEPTDPYSSSTWFPIVVWLVVDLPILKKMSQWEGWQPIYEMEHNPNVWNHQPVVVVAVVAVVVGVPLPCLESTQVTLSFDVFMCFTFVNFLPWYPWRFCRWNAHCFDPGFLSPPCLRTPNQWPFQEPQSGGTYMYLPYIRPM